jgi:hypothetical protein
MHDWSDKSVDWRGIDEAAEFIGSYCRSRALLYGQTKEKYGTVRFYVSFGGLSLHSICYPGYVYSQFPKWLWILDCDYIGPTLNFLFGKLLFKWQKFIYSRAYELALKKWPHLVEEIVSASDHPELIKCLKEETKEVEDGTEIKYYYNGQLVIDLLQYNCLKKDS